MHVRSGRKIHHGDTEARSVAGQDLTEQVIGAATEVHRALVPGLRESAHEECLCEAACEGLVEDGTDRVDVRAGIRLLAQQPLGRDR